MRLSSTILSLPLALGLAAGGASANTNLVVNGNFNSPGASSAQWLGQGSTFITGWTNYDNYTGYIPQGQTADQTWSPGLTGAAGPGYGVANGLVGPPSGDAYVVIDGTDGFGPTGNDYGYIDQSGIGLVTGQTYTLSFEYAAGQEYSLSGATSVSLVASLGDLGYSTPTLNTPSQGFSPWQEFSTTFTWDGSLNTLSLTAIGAGAPPWAMVTDVSISSAVPEPATWAMMALGFAGLGYAGFRSNRRRVAAIA